ESGTSTRSFFSRTERTSSRRLPTTEKAIYAYSVRLRRHVHLSVRDHWRRELREVAEGVACGVHVGIVDFLVHIGGPKGPQCTRSTPAAPRGLSRNGPHDAAACLGAIR